MLNGIVVVLHRDGRCVAPLAQPDNVGSIPQRLTVVVNIVSLWLPTGTLVNARVDLAFLVAPPGFDELAVWVRVQRQPHH